MIQIFADLGFTNFAADFSSKGCGFLRVAKTGNDRRRFKLIVIYFSKLIHTQHGFQACLYAT
jgi:hypothetical protein